jgi:hypothetical protein
MQHGMRMSRCKFYSVWRVATIALNTSLGSKGREEGGGGGGGEEDPKMYNEMATIFFVKGVDFAK